MSAGTARVPATSLVDDARGVARLAIDGVLGVTGIAERLHAAIGRASPPLGTARAQTARGIAGFVYARVRDVTRGVGWSIDAALRPFAGALRTDSLQRAHLLAALNGVIGDRLAETDNPLAVRMQLHADESIEPTARIAVFVHGLCMHDRQWPRGDGTHEAAARAAGYTPVYLHYNSGRAIEANGEAFADQLDALVTEWPLRVTHLALIGHSMGGLVARSACVHAGRTAAPWLLRLRTLVFLGTPHRGSALERAGTRIDFALGMSPYSAPFVAIGGARSAGIRDLGEGAVTATLPRGVRAYALAGRLKGNTDGLVGIDSALGAPVPESHRRIIEGAGHLDLLKHPEAVDTLARWLSHHDDRRNRGAGHSRRTAVGSRPVTAGARPEQARDRGT